MPTKSYNRFIKNLDTVKRLRETYDIVREKRGSKGRAAFDHITRSAVLFLAAAFEVYIEEVTFECCEQNISRARNADRLPHDVKSAINSFVKKDKTPIQPIKLCDEGWRTVYKEMVLEDINKLNTPKTAQIKHLFSRHIGISSTQIDSIPNINQLDPFVEFRGEITHRVKSSTYVKIEIMAEYEELIENLAKEIDKMILSFFRSTYPNERVPWNNTY